MVRRISSLGHEAPSVPFAEVPAVEGYLVVVQEIRSPSPAGIREGSFSDDGISFDVRHSRIDQRRHDVPHLSKEPAERLVGPCHTELHLGHMPSFMDGKHGGPWQRFRCIRGREGEEVHPFRCPCDRTVGCIVGMHHYRHPALVQITGASGNRYPVFFELVSVYPCEGVGALGIYYPEIVRVDAVPSQPSGIVTGNVELCPQTCRKQEQSRNRQKYPYMFP